MGSSNSLIDLTKINYLIDNSKDQITSKYKREVCGIRNSASGKYTILSVGDSRNPSKQVRLFLEKMKTFFKSRNFCDKRDLYFGRNTN